jgi:hypothetical protein
MMAVVANIKEDKEDALKEIVVSQLIPILEGGTPPLM